MSEKIVIKNCSPTLAGLKTGNLFNAAFKNKADMLENIRRWNIMFCKKGLRAIPLSCKNGVTLVYIYRVSQLSRDLDRLEARCILTHKGYPKSPEMCVARLAGHLKSGGDFPHEIGLFLGYPPEDVRGFMEKRKCKFAGCWKVYGDEDYAKKQFRQYKKCTAVYCRLHSIGITLERLTVAG